MADGAYGSKRSLKSVGENAKRFAKAFTTR